ncbi:MAG TPA: response regulator transcription factor [Prolixibacteraceae bacterium]|nr:response regulator transcription factor [Prolixibacteraceae bacterium]
MGSDKNTGVIIADPQYLIVEALQSVISQHAGFVTEGIARSRDELLVLLEKIKTGLLIIDSSSLGISIMELDRIRQQFPSFSWLILTDILTKGEFDELIKSGIRNIAYKNIEKQDLLTAIESTRDGKKFFSDEVLDLALESNERKSVSDTPVNLTSSEIDIVRLIANGMTTKEIATKRNISHHTVNTHRKNIFRKMEVSNSSELILQAIKAGLIDNIEYFI